MKLHNKLNYTIKNIGLILTLVFCCVFLLSCKNTDTYSNSKYFKENSSKQTPTLTVDATDVASTTELAKAISPAVVAIEGKVGNSISIGSGVCVKSGGYVLTNEHVIAGASEISLYSYDNTKSSVIVLYKDPIMDVAILKSSKALPYLKMANNEKTKVGEDVVAVGTPLSLNFTHTYTKGIVSALNRTIKITTTLGEALMQNLIQHDASINPGNSGGPLINAGGEVVGINTLKISSAEGLGFAIPIDSVVSIIDKVYNNYNYSTPFLGIYGHDAQINNSFYTESVSQTSGGGMYVVDVAKNSPAEIAGLQSGDVIIKVNNIETPNALKFRKEFYKINSGESTSVTFVRDGKTKTIILSLVTKPKNHEISGKLVKTTT